MHALPLPVLSEHQLTSGIVGTGRQPPQASSAVQSQPRSSCPCWEVLEDAGRCKKVLESAERHWKAGASMDGGL